MKCVNIIVTVEEKTLNELEGQLGTGKGTETSVSLAGTAPF